MSERRRDEYPVASLHDFLEEAAKEFRRVRLQGKVNLIVMIVILILISRRAIYILLNYAPSRMQPLYLIDPADPPTPFYIVDLILLLFAIFWTLNGWLKQRRFVTRWGKRFEKLETLEKQLLPEEP
jgi:hypothetical protein